MATYNMDIVEISKMRWNGSGKKLSAYGNTILHSQKEDRGESGVGLNISRQMRNTLDSWKPLSDHIILARFCGNAHRHVTIVQCYAPTEDTACAVKDEFYSKLKAVLCFIRRGDITLRMATLTQK